LFAKATLKIKGFVYRPADIRGPVTLLQDDLAEFHVPIRFGNTPRAKHSHSIHNHLDAIFAHPQTLADIGISKQAHPESRTSQNSTQPGKTLATPLYDTGYTLQ